jgi:hypothetical protein
LPEVAGTQAKNATSMTKMVYLLEWRHGGHRLAYVAAIARAAAGSGRRIVLVTTSTVTASDEYRTHVASLEGLGIIDVRIENELNTWRGKLSSLRDIRRAGSGAVIPEADPLMPVLLVAALSRGLPRPTVTILMRPPRWRQDGARSLVKGVLKAALITGCRLMYRSFDVQLLDDPLAEGGDRVWHAPLSGQALRLDDPCDLFDTSAGALPPELAILVGNDELMVVLGAIDSRKRVPLIIDAWLHSRRADNAKLVIAGRQHPDVVLRLQQADVAGNPSIMTIDRYLDNAEMGSILERSKGIFVLYDGGLSSGLLVTAASIGRWVIALQDSRTGRVAGGRGLAELCTNSVADVARAIENVLQRPESPNPVSLSNSLDFGRRVLRRFSVSTQTGVA